MVSTLYGRITDKIDPVVIGEMQRSVDIAIQYGRRLGVPTELINHLVKGYPSHGFVIDFEEAVALFPNCRLISDADSIMLFEIQKILYHEFDEDYTLMPHDNVFLAKITVDISEEERGKRMRKTKKNSITVRKKSMRIGMFSRMNKKPTVKYSISVDTKFIDNERLTSRRGRIFS